MARNKTTGTWSTERVTRATFALCVAALAIIGGIGFVTTRSAIDAGQWVARTLEIQRELAALEATMHDAGTEYRAFAETGAPESLARLGAEDAEAKSHLARLAVLTASSEQEQQRVAELGRAVAYRIAGGTDLVNARQDGDRNTVRTLLDGGESGSRMSSVRVLVDQMNDAEDATLKQRTDHAAADARRASAIGVITAILMLLAMAGGYVLIRNDARARRAAFATLEQSEDRFRSVVDGVRDYAMWLLDPAGNVASWNASAERVLGYAEGEILGKHVAVFQDPSDDASDQLEQASNTGRSATLGMRVRKDGTSLWADVTTTALRTNAGVLRGFAIVMRDLTEKRAADAALARSEAQLRQAQKLEAIGSLAGGIAHDFNNLLSVILSYTEQIIDDLKPEDSIRVDLEEVHKAGQRAADLTRQLLAFSRRQVLAPRHVNLNEILTGSEKMLRRLLNEDIELSLLTSVNLGTVFADSSQIEQVIMNLVVNARDAMPTGGKLCVETTNVDLGEDYSGIAPGPYVRLTVTDNGIGMDRATQERVFEPFFTTKDVGKGTGLGLSTVFGIVNQSGGHIGLYSEPGHGTTFKIHLPRTVCDREQIHVAPPSDLRGRETILLVEDEDQVRVVARTILRNHGYNVLEAHNSGEALLICEQYKARIDLLLTDVVMPLMSGRLLAERLAPLRPTMNVLYMSGYTDDAIVHHGVLDAGVAFLQKPITRRGLLEKVHAVLA